MLTGPTPACSGLWEYEIWGAPSPLGVAFSLERWLPSCALEFDLLFVS